MTCRQLLSIRGEAPALCWPSPSSMAMPACRRRAVAAFCDASMTSWARMNAPDRGYRSPHRAPNGRDRARTARCGRAETAGLIRRLNMAPRGTVALVQMREDVLAAPAARAMISMRSNADFLHLFCLHGLIAAFWNCGPSTGQRPPTFWKRSSAMRRCMKFRTGMICAAASRLKTGAASPSFIPALPTNR